MPSWQGNSLTTWDTLFHEREGSQSYAEHIPRMAVFLIELACI